MGLLDRDVTIWAQGVRGRYPVWWLLRRLRRSWHHRLQMFWLWLSPVYHLREWFWYTPRIWYATWLVKRH